MTLRGFQKDIRVEGDLEEEMELDFNRDFKLNLKGMDLPHSFF